MSRELKFRAWIKKRKGYRELDQLGFDNQGIEEVWVFPKDGETQQVYNPLDVVVEQYTGLKDKNGKEIYDGDRIKIEGSDTIYTVEYGRGVWVARFGDESGDNICLFHYVQKDTVLYAEVIGNVHEPPKDFRPEHLKRMGVSICKGGEE